MTARQWFRIHSFTGVITGLLLFVICWSGTVATLAHEIDWLVTPQSRVSMGDERAGWATMHQAVARAYPGAQVRRLVAPLYPAAAAEAIIKRPGQPRSRVYINPYTGQVQGHHSYVDVQRFFRSLHRRLFLPNPAGIYVVSIFSVTLLVSMIAALSFYKRWWRRFFQFRPGRGGSVWRELHKTGGLWGLWFLLLMALTGIWYGLEVTGFPDDLLGSQSDASEPRMAVANQRPLDQLLDTARQARPELAITTLYPPGSFYGDDRLRVVGRGGDWLLRDRVNYVAVANDGSVLATGSGSDLNAYQYWVHMADPLHFGDFAGLVSKLIWFAFGLLLCTLILTGTWLHCRRLAWYHNRHHWPGTAAALFVSLLVLLASVPFALEEIRGYGTHVGSTQHYPELAPGVAITIDLWIAVTVAIIAAWATLLRRSTRTASPRPRRR